MPKIPGNKKYHLNCLIYHGIRMFQTTKQGKVGTYAANHFLLQFTTNTFCISYTGMEKTPKGKTDTAMDKHEKNRLVTFHETKYTQSLLKDRVSGHHPIKPGRNKVLRLCKHHSR